MLLLPVKHLLQRRPGECLVACVAMVTEFVGQKRTYERVLHDLGTTDFTFFSNLDSLNSFWLSVSRTKGTLAGLQQSLDSGYPPIIPVDTELLPHWIERKDGQLTNGFSQHAVVVVGYDRDHLYINDPDFENAPTRVEKGWLADSWLAQDSWCAIIRRRFL